VAGDRKQKGKARRKGERGDGKGKWEDKLERKGNKMKA
jgi:hypothetical protein